MEIHLRKPDGEQAGPYTLEQINRDLAAKKYKDTDYWAWYGNLPEWIPLYKVPGIVEPHETAVWTLDESTQQIKSPAEQPRPQEASTSRSPTSAGPTSKAPTAPPPVPQTSPPPLSEQLEAGLPATALTQIFLLTTGDGREAAGSAATGRMLKGTIGDDTMSVIQQVPRVVLGECSFIEELRVRGSLPPRVWQAMSSVQPQLVEQARQGLFKVCVRTFPIENDQLVCLLLFYDKAKL